MSIRTTPDAAVTFDVGGTLIACWPSVGQVYGDVAAQHGFPGLCPAELNRRFTAAWQAKRGFDYSRRAWQRLVDATFAGMVSPPPSATFFDALYRRFEQPEAWKIFEDVLPALTGLRQQGRRLGIISNWDHRLRPLLQRLELLRYFDVVVISRESGSCKPSRKIFQEAIRRLDVPAKNVLHVGDSRREDVAGAQAAGCQARLLDRTRQQSASEVIADLRELLQPEPRGH